ncbi:hypothetical protein [Euzebyella saccharophila]|uniref:Uncharacterized protein n=1 Tax=Euzebyella saccharophila TaxID=679664 RepID=A0ABV8JSI1_9FLAO|nr:hypothetical protein [Euzebyella saccharophila]
MNRDLPLAVKAIQDTGLKHSLITTSVLDAQNELEQTILQAASRLGIKHYRTGWLSYSQEKPILDQMNIFKSNL